MSAPEPEGCFKTLDEHICLEDAGHKDEHECSCGVSWREFIEGVDFSRDGNRVTLHRLPAPGTYILGGDE